MLLRRVREARIAFPLGKALRLVLEPLSPRGQAPSFFLEAGIRVADTLRRRLKVGLARVESGFPRVGLPRPPLELVVERPGVGGRPPPPPPPAL